MAKSMILVADGDEKNRQAAVELLGGDYEIKQAGDSAQALALMQAHSAGLAAVLLSAAQPEPDSFWLLRQMRQEQRLKQIPVLAVLDRRDEQTEERLLAQGADEVIDCPYHAQVLRCRLRRLIEQKELQSERVNGFDELTGIYNRDMFFQKVRQKVQDYSGQQFAFIRVDINKFQLVNAFYGKAEGDRLLCHMAQLLAALGRQDGRIVYGRLRADVFCVCMPYPGREQLLALLRGIREDINDCELDYDIIPVFGIYLLEDLTEEPVSMDDKANLAVKKCKGNYINNYAFYEDSMGEELMREQRIVNSMKAALEDEQFVLYVQPKYDLRTDAIDGGEVLVRWQVPDKGMIAPGLFIPVFERNGFIMKLDNYVWEHACRMIRRWMDEGRQPYPISVNISRVSLYNPRLVDIISDLVKKYDISPKYLQLELTESAYTSNPYAIKEAMSQLQKRGFSILMDDFGSGYSSLNVLKDIAVDILKIDMKFLSDADMPGRSENILASVVRMAKWLGMPVIAEGVEKESQAAFLRSIGCEFVQGYYFARPMPVEEYEKLAFHEIDFNHVSIETKRGDTDRLWDSTSQMEILFSNMLQAVAIYEFELGKEDVDTIRVNNAFYDLFGYSSLEDVGKSIQNAVNPQFRARVLNAFEVVARTQDVVECEFGHTNENGEERWIGLKLKYMRRVGNRSIIFGTLEDITAQKAIEDELRKYRQALWISRSKVETILIVDDIAMNRQTLRSIFESEYHILEACDGKEALEIVKHNSHHIDVILLDVSMPVMGGEEFLRLKNAQSQLVDIPVVLMTEDDSPQQQVNALNIGAEDYVVKPFIPEVVIRRVCNVLDSRRHVGEVLQETGERGVGRYDHLTGLYSRNTAGQMISRVLDNTDGLQALLMIDVDNFAQVNERFGRASGDRVIYELAGILRRCFRKSDILARYGGDEFIVFVMDVPSREFVEQKCDKLLAELHLMVQDEFELECSIGVAVVSTGDGQSHFMDLIGQADQALYEAKHKGKNQWYIYKED